jgi:tRNA dimethylallyltransferase
VSETRLRCVCLTAPTASGKTEISLRLAERFPLEIVSMDSAMVYRGMDIGTAKPSVSERAQARHHLIDILDPAEAYSAGDFVRDAAAVIREIHSRGNLALVVGGTMLYLKALQRGLAELPEADAGIRAVIDADAARTGWRAQHRRLASVDPAAAARIAPNDRQRIQRALEVFLISGQPLSRLQSRSKSCSVDVKTLALLPEDRSELAERIRRRLDDMLEQGFVAEVGALHARGDLDASKPSIRSVGYRQIWAYLDGAYSLATAREKAAIATRQLAKRQMTWLRSGIADATVPISGKMPREALFRLVNDCVRKWY